MRLDVLLVKRGLFNSRQKAKEAIRRGFVSVEGEIVELVGDNNLVFMMDPDFENVFGLPEKGDKIRNAVEKVKAMNADDIPEVVDNAINKLVEL